LAILARNQIENYAGTEVYFDVANTRENFGSNVSGYEEPAVKTRNSYIDILPDETGLEKISKGSHEASSNLVNSMGDNCNFRPQNTPVGKTGLEQGMIQVLQSHHDESEDDEGSVEYIEPHKVCPNSYVTILPLTDE
jgi:hypothetical protein